MKILLYLIFFLSCNPPVTGRAQSKIWVTGYYTTWGVCGITPAEIDWKVYTHIIHQNIKPTQNPNDPGGWGRGGSGPGSKGGAYWQSDGGNLAILENAAGTACAGMPVQRQLIDSAHAHARKVILGLGGVGDGTNWVWMYENGHLYEYIRSVSDYAKLRGYDGLDIDWEYPSGAQMHVFYSFIRALKDTMNTWPKPAVLTIAAWNNVDMLASWDMDTVQRYVDQINIMNYDQIWGNNVRTGLDGALFAYDCDQVSQFWNNDNLLGRWVERGVSKKKLGMGIPYYGYEWQGGADGLCQRATATGGNQVGFEYVRGLYRNNPERYHWNDQAKCPYLGYTDRIGKGHFVSFQDTLSIFYKTRYAIDSGYGGLMIWELWRGVDGQDKNYLAKGIKKGLSK